MILIFAQAAGGLRRFVEVCFATQDRFRHEISAPSARFVRPANALTIEVVGELKIDVLVRLMNSLRNSTHFASVSGIFFSTPKIKPAELGATQNAVAKLRATLGMRRHWAKL